MKSMIDAGQLLRDYTENGSEAAFRELVARYIDLVYSVAVRRAGGDPHLAEDIVQTVFTDLARKALTLRHESMLGDRKSTRLNSSHLVISYAVFCLKKKTRNAQT